MRKEERNACPVCGSNDPAFVTDRRFYLRGLGEFVDQKYVVCTACGLGYTLDPACEADLKRYYAANTQERLGHPGDEELRHASNQLEFIGRGCASAVNGGHGCTGMSVLEFGPGNGAFLHQARKLGYRVLFQEWNPEAAANLREAGFEDFMQAGETDGGGIGLVAMSHCLEHVVDLGQLFRDIRGLLGEGGFFFAEVPDFSMPGRDSDDLMFEHVNFFSMESLVRLLSLHGFAVVNAELALDRDFSPCPKRVVRVLARMNDSRQQGVEGRGGRLVEAGARKQRSMESLDAWLGSLEPGSRLALAPGSWLTEDCLARTRLSDGVAIAVLDRDRKKWGTRLGTLEVRPPEAVRDLDVDWLLILNEGYEASIRSDYEALGVDPDRIIGWSRFAGEES